MNIKDTKDNKRQKLYKAVNHKLNFLSHRINYKVKNEEEKSASKKNNIKFNNSHESKNIIIDNYNKYLGDISSSNSNKSKYDNKSNSSYKKKINKMSKTKVKHKVIYIKNGIFSLYKNKLNTSILDNKNKEKIKNDFFKVINIKSIYRIKKMSQGNNGTHDINKNITINPLLKFFILYMVIFIYRINIKSPLF